MADAHTFAAKWKAAQPRLRRRVARYGLDDDAVDELLSDVTLVMFVLATERAHPLFQQSDVPLGDFVTLADTVAWKLLRNRQNREQRRGELREAYADRLVPPSATDAAVADEFESREWSAALGPFISGDRDLAELDLTPSEVEAVKLMIRGGPYSSTERSTVSRARQRIRDIFTELFVVVGGNWHRMRERFRNPPPIVPAAAAVLTGLTFGQFVPSGAESSPAPVPPESRPLDGQPKAADGDRPPQLSATAAQPAPEHPPTLAKPAEQDPSGEARPAVEVVTTATVPRPGQATSSDVSIIYGTPEMRTWVGTTLYCTTEVRRHICAAVTTAMDSLPSP